jgi:putative addiction module CopG family antidote
MESLTLPPDLEHFAAEAVASGRYRDLADVVRAGLALLRDSEAELAAFVASLEAARTEAARDGFVSIDELAAELDSIIAEEASAKV